MTILDIILQHLAAQNPPPTPDQQLQAAAQPIPIKPIVQALTSGGGMLNRIKDATNDKRRLLDMIDTNSNS